MKQTLIIQILNKVTKKKIVFDANNYRMEVNHVPLSLSTDVDTMHIKDIVLTLLNPTNIREISLIKKKKKLKKKTAKKGRKNGTK